MKTLKRIITNLILVLTLVILTSGVVYGAFEDYDVEVSAVRNSIGNIETMYIKVKDGGTVLKAAELGTFTISLSNSAYYIETMTAQLYSDGTMSFNGINARYSYDDTTGTITIEPQDVFDSKNVTNFDIYMRKGANEKRINRSVIGIEAQNYSFRIKKQIIAGNLDTYLVADGDLTLNNINGIEIYEGNTIIENIFANQLRGREVKLSGSYFLGKTYTIKERSTQNVLGTATLEALQEVDTSVFALTQLVVEGDDYYVVLAKKMRELETINYGESFKMRFTTEDNFINPIDTFRSNWNRNKNKFEVDARLYLEEYMDKNLRVNFYCDLTGLDYTIELSIPPMALIGDAVYVPERTAQICNTSGNVMDQEYIRHAMGYDTGSMNIVLAYDKDGMMQILDSRLDYMSGKKWHFGKINSFLRYDIASIDLDNVTVDSIELAREIIDTCRNVYEYYKVVKEHGDVTLYISIEDARGVKHKINFRNSPTFAELGLNMEDFEKLEALLGMALDSQAVCGDNGFHIEPEEAEKNFYVTESGIYYICQVDQMGVFTEDVDIRLPTNEEPKILKAGVLIPEEALTPEQLKLSEERELPMGQYIYYDAGTISYGLDITYAKCYPLVANSLYRIENNAGEKLKIQVILVEQASSESPLVEIYEETENTIGCVRQSDMPGYEQVQTAYILYESGSFFEALGGMLARFVRSLANGLNYLVQLSLQSVSGDRVTETIDIDKIIFNKYPDTSIAFFNSNVEEGGRQSKLITMLKEGVNTWYGVFQAIAVAGYIVMLLFIGVKILFGVGGGNKAKYKEMLMAWVSGLFILVFFPYVISMTINLNNQFVAMIDESKITVLGMEPVSSSINMSDFSLPAAPTTEDYHTVSSGMEENPYGENDNSYMAIMANRAHTSGNLVDAVVYLVMVWQFIMIVILYYKRVFTVAFLMAIFPFVALFYVIDKIGDNKAQAFQTWSKEIMVNIFVQSIHAIVYVFVIGATYTNGEYTGDWLLSIIAISFLFKGEEILKKIIGQGGETVSSLAKTASRTIASAVAIKKATSSVADNVVGASSHLGRTISTYRHWQKEKRILNNMDFFSDKSTHTNNMRPSTPPPGIPSGVPEYDELSNDVNTLNDWQNADPEALAKALDNVMANKNNTDPNIQGIMGGLNLTDDQLRELNKLESSTVKELVEGDKSSPEKYSELKAKIDQDMDMKLQLIFPESKEKQEMMKRAMYFKLRDGDRDNKHLPRSTNRKDVKAEFKEAKNRRLSFFNPYEAARHGNDNPFSEDARPSRLSSRASARKDSIMSTYFGTNGSRASIEEAKMAESIAMLKDFGSLSSTDASSAHKYTAKQLMDAAEYVAEHQNDSKQANNAVMNTLGVSGKDARAIVSEEIAKQFTDNAGGDKKQFRERFKVGAKAKIDKPTSGTNMEKRLAVQNTKDAWERATKYIKDDDAKAGDKRCYDESLNKVSVKDVMRKERDTYYDEDSYVDYLVHERELQNELEAMMIEDFAREQLDDLPEYSNVQKYEGLTREEHEQYAKDLRNKFIEELARTTATTSGVILGASIGAGVSIGISDGDSAIKEAATGVVAGTIAGDWVAETAFGREEKTTKVQIVNPYTGKVETFELQTKGLASDFSAFGMVQKGTIKEGEILRFDDPRLSAIKYDIDRKFIESKKAAEKQVEYENKKRAFDDALRNKRT